jgi:opacity protein-like surface antigen
MLGIRMAASLGERWTTGIRADIGGFGITDTDLTWSVTGGFDYRAWDNTSLKFGYRYYSIDYASSLSDGAFVYDLDMHGPYLAITFSF